MIDCGRPICLGPGYNMPAGKEGAAQFLKITHRLETPHFLRRIAKGWALNIWRALFSMWTSGGYTRWPENIQRAIKYPEIGISRYPRLRNGEMLQQQGAFCIVTNGLADGLNRGKRMKGGEEEGNDYPPLLAKAHNKDEQRRAKVAFNDLGIINSLLEYSKNQQRRSWQEDQKRNS